MIYQVETWYTNFTPDNSNHDLKVGEEQSTGVRNTGGGGYSHTLRIRVCAAKRGRDFEAPDLERGIHFRGVF